MAIAKQAELRVGRVLNTWSRYAAYLGGFVLLAVALMTVASILGRFFIFAGLRPITGDFELVEAGCAIAVFAFLPWCQMQRGHVTVDLVINRLPARGRALTGLIGDISIAILALLIFWRIWLGFGEKFPYGSETFRAALSMGSKPFFPETSYELQLPVWIPYGFATMGAALFALVSLYTVWRALNWVLDGAEAKT